MSLPAGTDRLAHVSVITMYKFPSFSAESTDLQNTRNVLQQIKGTRVGEGKSTMLMQM
jgi:hypothetical protein